MKRILLVAATATLLAAGCQKTEIINSVPENVMTFSTSMSKLTKAGADAESAGTVNLQEQNFRVWAYCAYDDPNTTAVETNTIYDGIQNLDVTYTSATEGAVAGWGTVKEYFWPGVGKELKFFAVSDGKQSSASTVAIGEDYNSLTVSNFEVTDQYYNTDLMVADFVQQHQGDKIVDLKFRHALSKVQFVFLTIASGDATVYVQDLVVKDLEAKRNLNVTPKAPANDEENGEDVDDPEAVADDDVTAYAGTETEVEFTWTLPKDVDGKDIVTLDTFNDDWKTAVVTDSSDEKYDEDFPVKIDGENATADDKIAMKVIETEKEKAQVFTTWLMIPQSIEGKKVEITYLINERKFTSIFPLETATLKAWDDNQYIKYTITLAPNLISFNPTVEEWTVPTTEVEHQN